MGFLEDMLLAPVRLVSGVARQAKIVIFAASAARAYKALEQVEEGDGKRAETERTHGENAQKLLELCQSLGGFFTKLGQILSTQTKVLPKEYVDAL
jgi:predicted unusual protein kinase regulating ubiquinone biosynthesis (AarF/ABC1/UbiB family)